jgi:hypothetical protein
MKILRFKRKCTQGVTTALKEVNSVRGEIYMTDINEDYFPCMVEGGIIQLKEVAGDFATDENGHIYRYLPGDLNEARRVTNFTPFKPNSADELWEHLLHRLEEKKKGNRLRIYSIEDFIEYLMVKGDASED